MMSPGVVLDLMDAAAAAAADDEVESSIQYI